MPISDDLRAYLDQAREQAREQGQKLADPQAIKSAVEPHLQRAKGYASAAVERASEAYTYARNDDRVGKYVQSAEAMAGTFVETVNTRIVQPALAMAGVRTDKRGGDDAGTE
jgi:hypothetical protein